MEAELDDLTRRLGDALDTKTPLKWKLTKENPPTTPPPDDQNEDDFRLGTVNNSCNLQITTYFNCNLQPDCFCKNLV